MSNKQLVQLAVVLVIVVALWGGLALLNRPTNDHVVQLAIPRIDTAQVDTVALTKAADTALIVRGADHRWTVNGHAPQKTYVAGLLTALADTTSEHTAMVAESKQSHASLGVTADSGQHVRVVTGGRVAMDWITGHKMPDYTGLYIRPAAKDAVYGLHGLLADAFERPISDWRNHTIADVPADSIQRVEVSRGRAHYTLTRSKKGWMLDGSIATNGSTAASLVSQFGPLTATGFPDRAQASAARFNRPLARVRIFGHGKSPMADLLFDSTKAGVWVRPDTGETVYALDPATLSEIAPTEETLRRAKPKPR